MPEDDKAKERRALKWQAPGPIRNRGEQETRDHRWKVAVEHLMDMPVGRREGRGQSELARKDRKPDQDRETRVDGSQQEEGPEAAREKRPSVAGPKSGDRDHDRAFRNVMRFISMRPGQLMTNGIHCLDPERTGKRCPSRVRLALISGHALGGMACHSRAKIGSGLYWQINVESVPKTAQGSHWSHSSFNHPERRARAAARSYRRAHQRRFGRGHISRRPVVGDR